MTVPFWVLLALGICLHLYLLTVGIQIIELMGKQKVYGGKITIGTPVITVLVMTIFYWSYIIWG